jgi:hypothetical protein
VGKIVPRDARAVATGQTILPTLRSDRETC